MRLRDIQRHSGHALGLSRAQIQGRSRAWRVARPRQIIMTMCRAYSRESLPKIGEAIGGRDHTTVLHAMKAVSERCAASPRFHNKVAEICALIESEVLHNLKAAQTRAVPVLVVMPPAPRLLPAPWHRLAKGRG